MGWGMQCAERCKGSSLRLRTPSNERGAPAVPSCKRNFYCIEALTDNENRKVRLLVCLKTTQMVHLYIISNAFKMKIKSKIIYRISHPLLCQFVHPSYNNEATRLFFSFLKGGPTLRLVAK